MIKTALLAAGLFSGVYLYWFSTYDDIEESIKRGEQVYIMNCLNCHMYNGEGVPNTYPSLAIADSTTDHAQHFINVILLGQKGDVKMNGESYYAEMPAQAYLTDEQIADVLNYVTNSWGNHGGVITNEMVKTEREKM